MISDDTIKSQYNHVKHEHVNPYAEIDKCITDTIQRANLNVSLARALASSIEQNPLLAMAPIKARRARIDRMGADVSKNPTTVVQKHLVETNAVDYTAHTQADAMSEISGVSTSVVVQIVTRGREENKEGGYIDDGIVIGAPDVMSSNSEPMVVSEIDLESS